METPFITRQYRNENTQGFHERNYDPLMHKLVITKKRKKRRHKPERLTKKKLKHLLTFEHKDSEAIEQNFPESITQILECELTPVKHELDAPESNQEIKKEAIRNNARKELGYKLYACKFSLKKGKLILKIPFPEL